MILLTPRIMKGQQEMAETTLDQKNRFSGAVKNEKPIDLNKELNIPETHAP
jgi:hypothetical protein